MGVGVLLCDLRILSLAEVWRIPEQGRHCDLPVEHRSAALMEGAFLRECHLPLSFHLVSMGCQDGVGINLSRGRGEELAFRTAPPPHPGLPRVRAEHLWGGGGGGGDPLPSGEGI